MDAKRRVGEQWREGDLVFTVKPAEDKRLTHDPNAYFVSILNSRTGEKSTAVYHGDGRFAPVKANKVWEPVRTPKPPQRPGQNAGRSPQAAQATKPAKPPNTTNPAVRKHGSPPVSKAPGANVPVTSRPKITKPPAPLARTAPKPPPFNSAPKPAVAKPPPKPTAAPKPPSPPPRAPRPPKPPPPAAGPPRPPGGPRGPAGPRGPGGR